jgi:hypothetical protein
VNSSNFGWKSGWAWRKAWRWLGSGQLLVMNVVFIIVPVFERLKERLLTCLVGVYIT